MTIRWNVGLNVAIAAGANILDRTVGQVNRLVENTRRIPITANPSGFNRAVDGLSLIHI